MNMMKNHKDDDYVKVIRMKLEIEAYFVAILFQIHVAYGHRQDKKGAPNTIQGDDDCDGESKK